MDITFLQVLKVVGWVIVAVIGLRLALFGLVFFISKGYFAVNPNAAEKYLLNKRIAKADSAPRAPTVLLRRRTATEQTELLR